MSLLISGSSVFKHIERPSGLRGADWKEGFRAGCKQCSCIRKDVDAENKEREISCGNSNNSDQTAVYQFEIMFKASAADFMG